MENRVKFFTLISMIERKHSYASLDRDTREIFNFIASRQVAGLPNDAAAIIEGLNIPRPTVYRKLTILKNKNFIREKWVEQKMNYELEAPALTFLAELLREARTHLTDRN